MNFSAILDVKTRLVYINMAFIKNVKKTLGGYKEQTLAVFDAKMTFRIL